MEELDNSQKEDIRPKSKLRWNKVIFNVLIISAVFLAGVAIGDNKIKFGPDKVFRESVQNSDVGDIDYDGINELYKNLVDGYDGDLDPIKLEEGLKSGLVRATDDPYTEFFNEEEAKDFNESLNGSFEGIGAELGKEGEFVVIISPIDGFPAKNAGLESGDIISKIDDESAFDITITDAVKKIRGEKGTKVKLEIIRDGEVKEFEITRDTINLPSVETEKKDDIGVIKISRFGKDTIGLVEEAARKFTNEDVKGVILDMRGNPGGLLDASVDVADLWLDRGDLILEEKRGGIVIKTFKAKKDPILGDTETIVLVNEGSASASEIVAGALRDNNEAIIIGQKTFGKGSVQEVRNLDDGGLLKVTVARWFTPSGSNIDQEGIKPDQEVEVTEEDQKAERDPQLDKAIEEIKK